MVESKSFRTKVRYANGGWERLNFNHWEGIPCPVEQNERHIAVLKEMISDLGLAPARLGLPMPPSFHNIVVVQPSCSVIGTYKGRAWIWRLDTLVRKVCNDNWSVVDMVKVVSQDTLRLFATKVAAYHKPAPMPKLNLPSASLSLQEAYVPAPASPSTRCHACGGVVSAAEARYCQQNESRFAGGLLCRKCQALAPKAMPTTIMLPPRVPVLIKNGKVPRCEMCGSTVDQKVVYYCRIESKRFAGRLLCRACQPSASKTVATAVPA